MILCWFTNKWSVYLKCGHDPEQIAPETVIWVKWSNCLFNTNWDRIGVLLIAQCFFLRWDQCSVEAGQHSGRTDELETSQQSGVGPEVYIGAGPGNAHTFPPLNYTCAVDSVFIQHGRWVSHLCVAVPGAGDRCVLAGLAFTLCCQVSAAGGLPGQPTSWNVSVPGATGNAVCWGIQTPFQFNSIKGG